MENSASKDLKRIKPHFKHIKQTYSFPMAFYRYKVICASFEPSLDELEKLCALLGNASIKYVIYILNLLELGCWMKCLELLLMKLWLDINLPKIPNKNLKRKVIILIY